MVPRSIALKTFLIFVLAAASVHAQSVDVIVNGTVVDQTAQALPGATVTATSDDTGVTRETITDSAGRYSLVNLPAGTYAVRVSLDGFAPNTRQAQRLHVGTTVTIDVTLALAGVAELVTVRGALPVLETTKNTLSRLVQREEIDTLPVINRNFNDLAALAPGVTKTGVYGGVDISGSRDFQNGYQVDGVSAERQHLGDQRVTYAQDWIQEFQVLTSQFTAEFGAAAGGVLNAITRSGSNQLSGRVYGFFRDDAWDAAPPFTGKAPPLDEHRIGGTVGGPLVRNRVFYFGGIERFNSASSSIVNSTFPSANGIVPSKRTSNLVLAKVEIFPAPAHTVRLRYNAQREQAAGASVGGTSTEEHGRFSDVNADDLVGGWSWTPSGSVLNEVRGAWSRSVPRGGCNFAARNPPGTWFERAYPGALFGCPVNFGTIAEDQIQIVDNLFWARSGHDMKVGIQTAWTRSDGDFRNFRDGRYSFQRDIPFDPADPASYPFAFLMIEGPTTWNVSAWSVGLFAQDTWRITADVALNAGVRYDVDGSLTALNPLVRLDRGMQPIDADVDNVAPRAGVAWTPFDNDGRTLVRGGAGLYYDQNHNNVAATVLLNNVLVDRIVTINANSPLFNPFWPDVARARAVLADALARNTVPDLSAVGGIAGATNDVDARLQIPRTTRVSAGVAHDFARWLNASADVVHTRGSDLYVIRDTNLDPVSFRRLNPNFSAISTFSNGGTSRYTSLQLQGNLMPSAGHFMKLAYTLARSRSNTNTTLSAGAATNPFDLSEDEGPADNDVRHAISINGSSRLPLALQVSGILSYRSALPYSATTSSPRPDGKPFGFRPEPRNTRRGDSALSLDVRLTKVISVGTTRSASAFVELFNVTNQTNYGGYVGTVTSSFFGRPTTATPGRRLQVGFRLDV